MLARVKKAAVVGGALLAGYAAYSKWQEISTESHVLLSRRAAGDRLPDTMEGHYFVSRKGLAVYYKQWPARSGRAKGDIFLVHGLGEHIGRYEHVALFLTTAGFNVFGIDHQGHGSSEGDRGHVERFQDLVDDYLQFVGIMRPPASVSTPAFLLGHSMGGLIAINIARQSENLWRGMLVSAPALHPGPDVTPALIKIAKFLSEMVPKITVQPLDISTLCRDEGVVTAYKNDPLVYHGPCKARLGSELLAHMKETSESAETFTMPCVFLHGSADKLVVPSGSEAFVQRAGSKDKKLVMYDGLFHELMNEPEKGKVMEDILQWINARL